MMELELNKKCPNCGAVIEHVYNHKCPYCRQYLKVTDNEIKKINNCEYVIDKVYISFFPIRLSYILSVKGHVVPKIHYYEESDYDNIYVSNLIDNPNVGYNQELSFDLFKNLPFNEVIDYVIDSIPPELRNPYNTGKIIECFMTENILERWRRYE